MSLNNASDQDPVEFFLHVVNHDRFNLGRGYVVSTIKMCIWVHTMVGDTFWLNNWPCD